MAGGQVTGACLSTTEPGAGGSGAGRMTTVLPPAIASTVREYCGSSSTPPRDSSQLSELPGDFAAVQAGHHGRDHTFTACCPFVILHSVMQVRKG